MFVNPKLINLIKKLAPSYLRIGGTLADRLHFSAENKTNLKDFSKLLTDLDGGECSFERTCGYHQKDNFTLTGHDWLKLTQMATYSDTEIIFGLNSLLRFDNGSWDYRNAESMLQFSNNYNLTVNWELGNEPNAFRHQFNYGVNASQMAKDFRTLRRILDKYPKYKESLLFGPDTTRPIEKHKASEIYLKEFLKHAGSTVNAVTWHQYYFNGRIVTFKDFLDSEEFDILIEQINTAKTIAQYLKKPIWLGETSSAYGGGAPGLSDRFIASFIWLDKLGLSAKLGIDVVVRQSIFSGNYALLDEDYNPNPDWWISVLYKRLVGSKVIRCYTATSKKVRLYCQCSKNIIFPENNPASVIVFGMNMDTTEAKIRIDGISDDKDIKVVYQFEITTDDSLLNKKILLNGELLKLTSNNDVPALKPKVVLDQPYLVMKPNSIMFWAIPNVNATACVE